MVLRICQALFLQSFSKKSIRIFFREIGLGIIQVMADQQVDTGAVALEAQLLVIALQKPLVDGVGDGLDGGLELLPVSIVQGHVQPHSPAQTPVSYTHLTLPTKA